MDDDQNKFILQLAIDTKFFHRAFFNPCTMLNQRRRRSDVRFTALLAVECLMANYWRGYLKGSHRMGDGWIFLKNVRDNSFNKDLSNEPNFGLIHLAGQYLY